MQNIWITWLRHSWSPSKYNNNPVWRQLKKWCNFLLQHRNFDTVRFVIMDITNGRVAYPLATFRSPPPPKKKKSPTALKNRHKIDNYMRKVNFFTLWSSPPLWNAWFSCHTTIRCSLVSHPVHGGKLLDRAVVSSGCCHADLKIKFNSYLVDWVFICIQVTLI